MIGLYSSNHYTDAHPWCISAGALSATIYIFAVYFGYSKKVSGGAPINSGVTGLCLQIVIIYMLEVLRRMFLGFNVNTEVHTNKLLYPGRPSWDVPKMSRFGEHTLTPKLLWKSMENMYEPMANAWWSILMFLTISLATPLVPQMEPPINPSGETGSDFFLYSPATVNGLPWWAFKIILIAFVPFIFLLVAIYKSPDDTFEVDEKKIVTEGIDPALVELTPKEMGRRSSYDEQNVLAIRRRSSISQVMEEMGLRSKDFVETEEQPKEMTRAQKRLSELVTSGHVMETIEDIVSEDDASAARDATTADPAA
jgi:hypothetical protein